MSNENEENQAIGSFNHSLVQAQLSALLLSQEARFSVFIALSLDAGRNRLKLRHFSTPFRKFLNGKYEKCKVLEIKPDRF
ncbi:MAG: hypothetical protein DRR16_31870 [Candidatus Parabeggiatoa sp. nov. 3]|nr:MAG: hypothetical protein DRR00_18465 [Gammaproteobacteria bacterium]RKZ64693.1 MAG: hypothetical protein DRQ99_14975 [Gammaproteobacteria bacterium]RKZ74788.1 MAG: hypothetical protein DRR16_31870 [Gammaproteobacteria bacterium]